MFGIYIHKEVMTIFEHLNKAGTWDLLAWKSNYIQYIWDQNFNQFWSNLNIGHWAESPLEVQVPATRFINIRLIFFRICEYGFSVISNAIIEQLYTPVLPDFYDVYDIYICWLIINMQNLYIRKVQMQMSQVKRRPFPQISKCWITWI